MKIVLELLDQPSNIRRINVRHDIVIGRGSECNLRLSAPQVSRRHCFLRIGRDSATITDLDSSNGTFLDEAKIPSGKRCDLHDGMTLAVGPIRFLVKIRDEVVAAEVLGEQKLNDSINVDALTGNRSGATKIESSDSIVNALKQVDPEQDDHADSLHDAAVFSLEHAGDVSEPHEETTDFLQKQSKNVAEVPDEVSLVDDAAFVDEVDEVEVIDEVEEIDEVVDAVEVIDDVELVEVVELVEDVEDVELVEDLDLIEEIEVIEDAEAIEDAVEVIDDEDDVSGNDWFADEKGTGAAR